MGPLWMFGSQKVMGLLIHADPVSSVPCRLSQRTLPGYEAVPGGNEVVTPGFLPQYPQRSLATSWRNP